MMTVDRMIRTATFWRYRLSRYWNRVAFAIIWSGYKVGKAMVWDYTGMNAKLLKKDEILSDLTRTIMCGF